MCGGASSRMGRSKVDVDIHGRPMITHILDTASALSSQVFLVGKPSQKTTLSQYGHTFISDHATTFHPLNGVFAGLEHAKESFEHVLFLPCDTPFISTEAIQKLWLHSPSVAIDPSGNIHPLLIHIPISWIERAQQYLQEERSMKSFAEPARLVTLSHHCLRNLNHPSDLPTPIR